MVSRFLLGAGFGGLLGTGVLALVSLLANPPRQAGVENGAPAASESPAAVIPGAEVPAEDAPEVLSEAPVEPPTEPPGDDLSEALEGPEEAPALADEQNLPDTESEAPVLAEAEAPEAAAAEGADSTPAEGASEAEAEAGAAPEPQAAAADQGTPDLAEPDLAAPPASSESAAAAPMNNAPQVRAEAPAAPEAPREAAAASGPLPAPVAPPAAGAALPRPGDLAEEAAPEAIADPGLPPLTAEEQALLEAISSGELPLPELAPPGEEAGEAPADSGVRRLTLDSEQPGKAVANGLPGSDSGVETARLPRIGDLPPEAAETPAEAVAAPLAEAKLPRELYARDFENPGARPLYAVVLIDEGAADVDRAVLAKLPFPVTFALDPQDPAAAERAALYRAAGQEVVMLASFLPKGAVASDLEVAFAAMGNALPEAVAVMDMPERSFQNDRPLSGMIVPVVAGQGRGLLTWNAGLNAADQVAKREDLPSAVIFRALDAENEDVPLIRRYLDRAAFKAVQDGQVTVVGRVRPETIAALLEWSLEGRAASVALAPVTAVLRAD